MKPASTILFTALLLVPWSMDLPQPEAASSREELSPHSLHLNNQSFPRGQQDALKGEARITKLPGNLPLYFVENKGQVDNEVKYCTKTKDGAVYFTGEEIVYQFLMTAQNKDRPQEKPFLTGAKVSESDSSTSRKSPIRKDTIRMSFVGAGKEARLEAQEEQEAKFNYFRGNDPQKWVSGARSFRKVAYRELYPGIDLLVSGREGRMKNEYVVKPGAEPSAIRVKYEGAKGLRVNEKGQLEIQMPTGLLIEDVPLSYQIIDGKKREVRTSYWIVDGQTVQFQVGEYRKDFDLIIDPLTYSTFLGGSEDDLGLGIAVDGIGNVYVTGAAFGIGFPTTAGAYDTSHNGIEDVFVSKLDPSGSALLYSTLLGGSEYDYGCGLAVDGNGNAYVGGYTASPDYPTTAGAYDTSSNGQCQVFITKLNPSGSALFYSTFIGGNDDDSYGSGGIAIDGSGNAYVTGYTESLEYPTTAGAFDTIYNGGIDIFVTKLNPSGSDLVYSTFLGGSSNNYGYGGIKVDGSGNAYIAGHTWSVDFPTTSGAYDVSYNGAGDVFITKLNSSGSALVYSTFLGGSSYDACYADLAIDGSGNAYVTGRTSSSDFPTSAGAFDSSFNGGTYDLFVAKLNAAGNALLYSTFLGGNGYDYDWGGIAVDGSGNAHITGSTKSSDFPTTSGAYDTSFNGGQDAFIAGLDPSGSLLLYSTFLGGSYTDNGLAIAVAGIGNVYVTGDTTSGDFPTTPGAYSTTHGGSGDVFITNLFIGSPDIRQPISDITFGNVDVGSFSEQTTTIYNDGDGTLVIYAIDRTSGSADFIYKTPTVPFAISAGGSQAITVKFFPISGGSKAAAFNVNSNDPDEPDVTFDVSGTGVVVAETISTPNTPAGPTTGLANTSYTYSTGGSTSDLGHDIQYLIDWGDGTDSGWLAVGTTSAQKSWSSANTYTVKAKARCATHTLTESSWSSSLSVSITPKYDNSPSNYQVIPECIWAAATGGGTWITEVQITDVTGGSAISVYFDYGGGNRRGPFALWTSWWANCSAKYSNILSYIDAHDPETFTYYGRVGALEFSTQDAAHRIQVVARTLNVNYSKTFPGLNLTDSNTADTTRRMIIQNLANNATYRSSCGFFNPTADSVTVEFRLLTVIGGLVGSAFSRTFAGYDFQSFSPFNQAGVPYPAHSYDNVVLWITATSGTGKVMVYGASANNTSNDPAAHIGVQYQGSYDNSPSDLQVIPECIWASATGGGTWVSEAQITDITGGSVVSVYFDYGAGNRRGPFTLWTSPGPNRNAKYTNILSSIDALDPESFAYYGRVGAVEFMTQDPSHKILVAARTLNGNYSKTFPGLNLTDSNTATTSRRMIVQNVTNNITYRATCGLFNPTADSITVELRLMSAEGNLIGSAFSRTLVGYDFQSFSPFNQAGVPYPTYFYDNVVLWVTPTSGSGRVMVFGASANNNSNDPAAHIAVQYQ